VAAGIAKECEGEVLNIATGREVSVREVAEAICERVGLSPERFISYQQPRPGDVRRHAGDASRLADLTGHRPSTPFEEGLNRTLKWFTSAAPPPSAMLADEKCRSWE
jgi:nucleoside-diphosphate-sugar epimerase